MTDPPAQKPRFDVQAVITFAEQNNIHLDDWQKRLLAAAAASDRITISRPHRNGVTTLHRLIEATPTTEDETMALTVTESTAVNRLLDYFLHRNPYGEAVTEQQALSAAELLAEKAYARLMAGIRPIDVAEAWARPARLEAASGQEQRSRFRKKPVEVDAFHFDGSGQAHAEVDDWAQALVDAGIARRPAQRPSGAIFEGDYTGLYIFTLEGRLHASPGDWVICGVQGEFYPCKPDIFEQTYEPAR